MPDELKLPKVFNGSFKYDLNTQVWFKDKDKLYEGRIILRTYGQRFNPPDYNAGFEKASMSQSIVYAVENASLGLKSFNEYEFNVGNGPYTDKDYFIEKHVFIK